MRKKEEYVYSEEEKLFSEVRDYIRENVVNEFQVAEHFNISLNLVKKWIREERIQYAYSTDEKIKDIKCSVCKKPIMFGTVCRECQKKLRMSGTSIQETGSGHMYTFDKDN